MDDRPRAEPLTQEQLSRLFERLRDELPAYQFDESKAPFHSSYDNWQVFGKTRSKHGATIARKNSAGSDTRPTNIRTRSNYERDDSVVGDIEREKERFVVARVSKHALRLEREFRLSDSLCKASDGACKHFVQPIQLTRLPVRKPGDMPLVVSVVEAPGKNYLRELVEFGPNFYVGTPLHSDGNEYIKARVERQKQIPLLLFLDFAIGASECCEILHHGNEMVHGELRGDAFHYNKETGAVRLVNFGSGVRSFENGLTSAGWSSLMSEVGVEHKLQFIAPEQTGRLPAEPDSRTDIYSLGILFWTMLTGQPAFEGQTPLDIMQNVLSRRVPPVSALRPDVPDAVSSVIQKMTHKSMDERYNSASGVKHDLQELTRILTDGDTEALGAFKLAKKDLSCFWNLPSQLVGRETQRKAIIDVIQESSSRLVRARPANRKELYSLSSGSSIMTGDWQPDLPNEDVASDSTSSGDRDRDFKLNSISEMPAHDLQRQSQQNSQESTLTVSNSMSSISDDGTSFEVKPLESNPSVEPRLYVNSTDSLSRIPSNLQLDIPGSLLRTAHKIKRKGRTEVIAISGNAGYGKSSLVQAIQPVARKHGYFTSAKFDSVKRAPFEPVLRVMSSLFRQIFSENDVNTDFHNNIRTVVKPFWPTLHAYLELPIWLLAPTINGKANAQTPLQNASQPQAPEKKVCNGQTTQDWLRSGGSNKSSRFMHVFLDVLRFLAVQKFICFGLDDLQFADRESLDLIQHIIAARIPIVLLVTYRADDLLPPDVKQLLDAKAMKIALGPFSDEEAVEYVSAALHREREYCLPLVAVVQEKTHGNPFFVREMLDSCYRKRCIYYCWRGSHWEYSLDKVFDEFSSPDARKFSSNDFIARRLQELPQDSRALLAWASIIGNTFSFALVKQVMACDCSRASPKELLPPTSKDAVAGLQTALTSYVLMSTDDEDRFRFSHDRYLSAADSLCDQHSRQEMHFVVSQAMLKHDPWNASRPNKVLFDQARHICEGFDAIKKRVKMRAPYRDLLYQAAETARETGARTIGLYYYNHCLNLLQENPWEDAEDARYQETLTLFTKAAEAYWYMEQFDEAAVYLEEIFSHARVASDKAPAAMIKSRMYAQRGDSRMAFLTLKQQLLGLGVDFPPVTYEDCDAEFERITPLVKEAQPGMEACGPGGFNRELLTLGAVLVELLSASFWTDALLFYQGTLRMLNICMERGMFPQIGIGLVHLGSIAVYRFGMVEFGIEVGNTALNLFNIFESESYTVGRGLTLHALFLGHLQTGMCDQFPALQRGLNAAILAGDRILHLLNLGIISSYRLWGSNDLQEVEAFIGSVSEEFPDWGRDVRGGAFLTAVRQYVRALQGKTNHQSASEIFSDEFHRTETYRRYLCSKASNPERPLTVYKSYMIEALFRFGYYREVLELGNLMTKTMDEIWCMRFSYSNMFYISLSIIAMLREQPDRADREQLLKRVETYSSNIRTVSRYNPVNYAAWLRLLEAEIADVSSNYGLVLSHYEAAVDHTVLHGLILDEAVSYELYADFLIRRGAARPARNMIVDCIACYRGLSAFGKADQVTKKYEFLLYGTRSLTTVDQGTQTDLVDNTPYKLEQNEVGNAPQSSADRTQAWLTPSAHNGQAQQQKDHDAALRGGLSAAGLDMIDLASILESSQLLSSELQVDKLLAKLTDIILESTGADICGIVVEEEDAGWVVASTGGRLVEGGENPTGTPLDKVDDQVAKQVTLYVLRFKETVFLRNVIDDERFANVPAAWLKKNPGGASMIALPILHGDNVLLGSLYVQAPPNSFTERSVTVLRLLVSQISISIANALLFNRIKKVSASNQSMLEVQKQALMQARDSEKKAKLAETKAIEMVRLKEEAAKAKSMFLANVSHELRTPLNGVIGMSEMLKSTQLSKEQEEHADSIRVCADTLLSVINDILDFSKLEAGKLQTYVVPLSLTETISEVVRALSYTNLERGLKTVELLELDPHLLVMGDPVRLHQILMNLLSNAYKFTSKGCVTVRAVVEHEDVDALRCTISVSDTGIGISEEQRKKLFLPFSQADSSTARSYGGTGLGLSICKAIIENVMRGRIWLESVPGVGTTVFFTLSFKKCKPGTMSGQDGSLGGREPDPMAIFTPATEEESLNGGIVHSLAGIPRDELKVCIAEDNPINQKIAISFVTKLGFKCEAYGDGQQAVDALSRASKEGKPFHLVLMDVQMPVLDGYDATREIRKHPDSTVKDVLVIAMTASAIRGDREKCLEAGMNNYLAKPVRADTLKQMLESYLHQPVKAIPNIQQEANKLVDTVESDVAVNGDGSLTVTTTPFHPTPASRPSVNGNRFPAPSPLGERPRSARHVDTEIRLTPDKMVKQDSGGTPPPQVLTNGHPRRSKVAD